jgi:hypothetical protein
LQPSSKNAPPGKISDISTIDAKLMQGLADISHVGRQYRLLKLIEGLYCEKP